MEKDIINITTTETSRLYAWTLTEIQTVGLSGQAVHWATTAILLLVSLIILIVVDFLIRKILKALFIKLIKRSTTLWDDFLLNNKVLDYGSHLVPLLLAQQILPAVFQGFPSFTNFLIKFLAVGMVLAVVRLFNGLLKTVRDILKTSKAFIDKPLDSYLQVAQIFLYFVGGTILFSVVTGNSPWSFLVSLGAASAILMLVFKDTILGFVASIQVSANDSVRVGDWIEMPKYGADGNVIQMNLNNVRIQNFDKTIVTIPTHTLLSDSFKNYRGMQQSGGRRIKRAIHIKISSIRYLTEKEIAKLKRIQLLAPYIEERQQEIDEYNARTNADQTVFVNGRRMTNVGLFRAYVTRYAEQHPDIHKGMTLMVRHLAPNEHGLPLELYMFTNNTDWAYFENVMANIFDHLFAAIKYFDLEVFELPSSDDLRLYLKTVGQENLENETA